MGILIKFLKVYTIYLFILNFVVVEIFFIILIFQVLLPNCILSGPVDPETRHIQKGIYLCFILE